jgi:hypothetical protein
MIAWIATVAQSQGRALSVNDPFQSTAQYPALRQPAARASASEQKYRSPFE